MGVNPSVMPESTSGILRYYECITARSRVKPGMTIGVQQDCHVVPHVRDSSL